MPPDLSPHTRETAARWHERLQRDKVSDDTRRDFERWIQASPDHRAAYEAIERAWTTLQSASEAPPILALRHEAALRLTRRTSRQLTPLRAMAAALAILAIGTVALALVSPSLAPRALTAWVRDFWPGGGRYTTATGERLTATLQDGSQVTLDTQSELEVAFTEAERLVRLKRGQAFFEVAKGEARPFVVEVDHRRLVAVGTAFDVRLDDGQIRVTMVEGVLRVEPAERRGGSGTGESPGSTPDIARAGPTGGSAAPRMPATTISAGQQLIVNRQSEDHVLTADPERATSWRRGQLIFDAVRLGDAIAEVNRYSQTKIELADPALAEVRISGSFATGRSLLFVEAVTTYFPIEVSESSHHAVILKARR